MPKFRKKPVVIEAVQWDGIHASYLENAWPEFRSVLYTFRANGVLGIPTLEGEMQASEGDWIIKGIQGEFYPCKPDIFAATYEPVDE